MNCTICKIKLSKHTKSGTCSRKCNMISMNKISASKFIANKCKECDKEIKVRQSRRIFCGEICQHNWGKGRNHYNWKGGRFAHSEGYIVIHRPEHPMADKRGNILEHRLIAEDILLRDYPASGYLKDRSLAKIIVVHHINHDKSDNRPSNLYLCKNQSEHMDIHRSKRKDLVSNFS